MNTKALCVAAVLSAVLTFGLPASAEIKIGSVLSTTGPESFLGEPEHQTLELYVNKIKAAGGINGEKIKLISDDDASDANLSRTFATRLVQEDKVDFVIAGSGTGNSLAMLPIFDEAKLPFVSLSGGVKIVEPVRKWVFKPRHTDRMAFKRSLTICVSEASRRLRWSHGKAALRNRWPSNVAASRQSTTWKSWQKKATARGTAT